MAWKSEEDYNLESEFWNPEEGDVLEGDVLLVKKGNYEKLFMIIEDEDGNSWITTQCARLDFQIKKMKIEEGDIVKLTYNGRVGENDAHDYKLEVWEEDQISNPCTSIRCLSLNIFYFIFDKVKT